MSEQTKHTAADVSGEATDGKGVDVEALYYRYGPMVTRRCRALLGNEEEAADAAQEIFVKPLSDDDLRRVNSQSKYLWKAATNHCLNLLRDKARWGGQKDGETLLERIACLNPDNDAEARATYRSVLEKLFGLHPASSRVIAALHLVDGITLEETAEIVEMSVSGVRKRLRALKATLGELMGN